VLAGGSISSEEYILLKKDSSTFYGEVSAACLKDPQGQAIGIIIIMRDITKRKQAEEISAKLEDQLHQAQRMESIGRLAGGIAHDFNNLLTVIHGYCDIIQDQLAIADPLLVELKQIQQASERAAALTDVVGLKTNRPLRPMHSPCFLHFPSTYRGSLFWWDAVQTR
jgi:signal transduction histidine kinase